VAALRQRDAADVDFLVLEFAKAHGSRADLELPAITSGFRHSHEACSACPPMRVRGDGLLAVQVHPCREDLRARGFAAWQGIASFRFASGDGQPDWQQTEITQAGAPASRLRPAISL
jgi:hypothetical protein